MSEVSSSSFILSEYGGRESITTSERANELAQPLIRSIQENKHHLWTTIVLSNKSFSPVAATVFSEVLAKLPNIKIANFSDIIAGQNTEDAVQVLSIITGPLAHWNFLEEFNLSDNALGLRGIQAIGKGIRHHRSIRRLFLNNDGLQGDAVYALNKLLLGEDESMDPKNIAKIIKANGDLNTVATNLPTTNLEQFSIFNNLLTDDGGFALVPLILKSPKLSALRIETNRISTKGGIAIVKALLHSSKQLTNLTLCDNNFGEDAGKYLSKIIKQNDKLNHLNLSDLGLEQSIKHVLKAICSSNVKLNHLDIGYHTLTKKSKECLKTYLSRPDLVNLGLSLGNCSLKNAGTVELLNVLLANESLSLSSLNLSENHIRPSREAKIISLLSNLIKRHQLKSLHLTANYFSEEQIQTIKNLRQTDSHVPSLFYLSEQEDEDDEEDDEEEEEDEEDEEEDEVEVANANSNDAEQIQENLSKVSLN